MNATIKLENVNHFPVLLKEVISIISPLYGGTFIDCTFGQGGYSKKILENKSNKIFAIDRDYSSKKIANQFKKKYHGRFKFENRKFSEIFDLSKNIENPKGIIFDLGEGLEGIVPLKRMKKHEKNLIFTNFKEGDSHEVTVQEVDEEYRKIILMIDLGLDGFEGDDEQEPEMVVDETEPEKLEIPQEVIDQISENDEKSSSEDAADEKSDDEDTVDE